MMFQQAPSEVGPFGTSQRVLREEPFDVCMEIAEIVADAERRPFEDAELLGHC